MKRWMLTTEIEADDELTERCIRDAVGEANRGLGIYVDVDEKAELVLLEEVSEDDD